MLFKIKAFAYHCQARLLITIGRLFSLPKPVLFVGQGTSLQLCKAIADFDCKRCLLVTDAVLCQTVWGEVSLCFPSGFNAVHPYNG